MAKSISNNTSITLCSRHFQGQKKLPVTAGRGLADLEGGKEHGLTRPGPQDAFTSNSWLGSWHVLCIHHECMVN